MMVVVMVMVEFDIVDLFPNIKGFAYRRITGFTP